MLKIIDFVKFLYKNKITQIYFYFCILIFMAFYIFHFTNYNHNKPSFAILNYGLIKLFIFIVMYVSLIFITKIRYLFRHNNTSINNFTYIHGLLWNKNILNEKIIVSTFFYTWSGFFILIMPLVPIVIITFIFSLNNIISIYAITSTLFETIFFTILFSISIYSLSISLLKINFPSIIYIIIFFISILSFVAINQPYLSRSFDCINNCSFISSMSDLCSNCKFKQNTISLITSLSLLDTELHSNIIENPKVVYEHFDHYVMKSAYKCFIYLLLTMLILIYDYLFLNRQFNQLTDHIKNNILNEPNQ